MFVVALVWQNERNEDVPPPHIGVQFRLLGSSGRKFEHFHAKLVTVCVGFGRGHSHSHSHCIYRSPYNSLCALPQYSHLLGVRAYVPSTVPFVCSSMLVRSLLLVCSAQRTRHIDRSNRRGRECHRNVAAIWLPRRSIRSRG